MSSLARLLMASGLLLFLAGVILAIGARFGWEPLPGNFAWHKNGVSLYIPLAACVLLSIILTVVLNILLRFFR